MADSKMEERKLAALVSENGLHGRLIADRKGCWNFILTYLLNSSTYSICGGGGIHRFCPFDAETIIYLGKLNTVLPHSMDSEKTGSRVGT